MKKERLNDWPERLLLVLSEAGPFRWGRCDCVLFACDAVTALVGQDLGERFRGRYKTALGAASQIHRYGGGGLEAAVEKMVRDECIEEVSVKFAQRGDVVMVDLDAGEGIAGPALAVCVGAEIAFIGLDGLGFTSVDRARRAWAIGR